MTYGELYNHLKALKQLGKRQVTVDVDALLEILDQADYFVEVTESPQPEPKPRVLDVDAGIFTDGVE